MAETIRWDTTPDFQQGDHDYTTAVNPWYSLSPGVDPEFIAGETREGRYDINDVLSVMCRLGYESTSQTNVHNEGLAPDGTLQSGWWQDDPGRAYVYQPDITVPYHESMAVSDPRDGGARDKFAFGMRFLTTDENYYGDMAKRAGRFRLRKEGRDLYLYIYEDSGEKEFLIGNDILENFKWNEVYFRAGKDELTLKFNGKNIYEQNSFYQVGIDYQGGAADPGTDLIVKGPTKVESFYLFGMDEYRIERRTTGSWHSQVVDFGVASDGDPNYYSLSRLEVSGYQDVIDNAIKIELSFEWDESNLDRIADNISYSWEMSTVFQTFYPPQDLLLYGRFAQIRVYFSFDDFNREVPEVNEIEAVFEEMPPDTEDPFYEMIAKQAGYIW